MASGSTAMLMRIAAAPRTPGPAERICTPARLLTHFSTYVFMSGQRGAFSAMR
jgi:hypothetical protein